MLYPFLPCHMSKNSAELSGVMMKTLFVSSTFQDMQSERDAIRDIVLPRLNAEAQKYGQSVAPAASWGSEYAESRGGFGQPAGSGYLPR